LRDYYSVTEWTPVKNYNYTITEYNYIKKTINLNGGQLETVEMEIRDGNNQNLPE